MAQAGDQDRDALIAQASEWLARLDAEPQIDPATVRDLYQGERS